MGFKMEPGKKGRVKYLILTLRPAYLMTKLLGRLASLGIIPANDLTGFLTMAASLAMMGTLGYFLVFRKNHTIEVSDISLAERDWRGKVRLVAVSKIRSWKCNLLGELLLLDENNKVLLCVESNMENRDRFLLWLTAHHINER